MKLVFWHNIISPHQAPFMRELSEAGHEVVVVSAEAMSKDRERLGWVVPSLGSARIILSPTPSMVFEIVQSSDSDSIHIIAGARGTSLGRKAARACFAMKRRVGIITESPDTRGLGGLLRWVKYSWERYTLGKHFDFILAMGKKGVHWFNSCGHPAHKVFPFVYVTERLSVSSRNKEGKEKCESNNFHFLFVGQLISRKGVDVLLRALHEEPSAELSVIGHGSELNSFQKLARECSVANRVKWLGQMDAPDVHNQIAKSDVLILPSRHDGWGAVVNESLMVGTPVICSTACGASELIRYPWLGSVFKVNHAGSLAKAMSHWRAQGPISKQHRERVRHWSRCIEAPLVAKYIEEVMAHVYDSGPRPQAPWRE